METSKYKSGDQLSSKSILTWRIIQSALGLIGAGVFFCLIFYPPIGINLFWNILILVALAGELERLAELQCFSSEEKFKKLLTRSPHILNIVPLKYLANYLGIDPTNFSKLINRVII